MSAKNQRIAELVAAGAEPGRDARYSGYFYCFNRGMFFEAHEVLESLWLVDRSCADGGFYKGLIQLAGAFVQIQKRRPGPAVALFGLARVNLSLYPARHQDLNLAHMLNLIDSWRASVLQGVDVAAARLVSEPPVLALAVLPAHASGGP